MRGANLDSEKLEHSGEVEAGSLYEDVALAVLISGMIPCSVIVLAT